jgi:hypothetical protein
MDLIFNELSVGGVDDFQGALSKFKQFIEAASELRTQSGKNCGIRFETYYGDIIYYIERSGKQEIRLSEFVKLQSLPRIYKDIFWSICRKPPIIKPDEDTAAHGYRQNKYSIDINEEMVPCIGLAVAHLLNTLAISFNTNTIWQRNQITIQCEKEGVGPKKDAVVGNIFSKICCGVKSVKDILEGWKDLELVKSTLEPIRKPIKLGGIPHHGSDLLLDFAKRVRTCEYVTAIGKSLKYDTNDGRFISDYDENGIIKIRLHWTGLGLGLTVKTTGRNSRETRAIAEIIEKQWNRH